MAQLRGGTTIGGSLAMTLKDMTNSSLNPTINDLVVNGLFEAFDITVVDSLTISEDIPITLTGEAGPFSLYGQYYEGGVATQNEIFDDTVALLGTAVEDYAAMGQYNLSSVCEIRVANSTTVQFKQRNGTICLSVIDGNPATIPGDLWFIVTIN